MSLIWADGFDHYTTSQAGRFYEGGSNITINLSGTVSRTGLGCLTATGPVKVVPSRSSYIAGAAVNGFSGTRILTFFDNNNSIICYYSVNAFGFPVAVFNGSSVTALTNTNPNDYQYVELKATNIGTGVSNGTMTLRVNGISVLTVSGITHANAGGSTGAACQAVGFGASPQNFTMDDIYICDTSGATHNDFLGPISVYTIWPTADGSTQQWATNTPNASPNEYKNVNEKQADDDTSYNATGSTGLTTDYAFNNSTIPSSQILQAVGVFNTVRNDLAGAATLVDVIEQSNTLYFGSTPHSPSTAYQGFFVAYDVNPNTSSAWTMNDINFLGAGLNRNS